MIFNIVDFQKFCKYSIESEKSNKLKTNKEKKKKKDKTIILEQKKFKKSIFFSTLYTIYEDSEEN